MSLHPTDGVRILLELVRSDGKEGAEYRAAIYTPTLRADFDVRFDAAGQPQMTPSAEGLTVIAGDGRISDIPFPLRTKSVSLPPVTPRDPVKGRPESLRLIQEFGLPEASRHQHDPCRKQGTIIVIHPGEIILV